MTAEPLFVDRGVFVDVTRDRIRWLVRMRWGAMVAALFGAGLGAFGWLPGLAWPVMAATAGAGLLYNLVLLARLRGRARP
ncbi:MAG: hypothetical protein KC586_26340, partial [Myxococcales bacterium]|nr:hypothetical protein [Myxococcales bacterium]